MEVVDQMIYTDLIKNLLKNPVLQLNIEVKNGLEIRKIMYPILDTRVECKGSNSGLLKVTLGIRIEPDWNVKPFSLACST